MGNQTVTRLKFDMDNGLDYKNKHQKTPSMVHKKSSMAITQHTKPIQKVMFS